MLDSKMKLESVPNEANNRYSAPLHYQGDHPPDTSGRLMNNRRSAPEFLNEWKKNSLMYQNVSF